MGLQANDTHKSFAENVEHDNFYGNLLRTMMRKQLEFQPRFFMTQLEMTFVFAIIFFFLWLVCVHGIGKHLDSFCSM